MEAGGEESNLVDIRELKVGISSGLHGIGTELTYSLISLESTGLPLLF